MSSDLEDLEVDFLNYHPNQHHEVPADIPQEPNPPADTQVEEQQEQEPHIDVNIPAGDAEEQQNPGNFNPAPAQSHPY